MTSDSALKSAVSELEEQISGAVEEIDASVDRRPEPQVLVIFGASGDLAHRKLLPALASLAEKGSLPRNFSVVGIARSELSDEQFQKMCVDAVGSQSSPAWEQVTRNFRYLAGDYTDPSTFQVLSAVLRDLDERVGTAGNRVYYLATIPSLFASVAAGLGSVGANRAQSPQGFVRLVVEKPFGSDLPSALELDSSLHQFFDEEQIFRIDHYMGKETVLNVLALRFANAIFEPIWNRRYVDHVQVTVAETIGVEHRGNFYEQAGALRDIVQNHVMQVLSLTLMEPPGRMESQPIRDEKVKLLRSIVIPSVEEVGNRAVRGQYVRGRIDGMEVPGYREEDGVDQNSHTETYVAMCMSVDNWRWAGVPIFVRTGKRLKRRATEVSTVFQRPPHLPFAGRLAKDLRPDTLTLRIQPDEGMALSIGAKVPGPAFGVRSIALDFSYAQAFPGVTADAYERLLLDAMIGDAMLFIRSDEVMQDWAIMAPIQQAFAEDLPPLAHYVAGSWGPNEAERLIEATNRSWRNP